MSMQPRIVLRHDFSGQVALVTGGAQGIGSAYAAAFAAAGARVVIADRDGAKAAARQAEVDPEGARCLAVCTDVSDATSARQCVEQAVREFGRIDVLVNNAAIASTLRKRPFDELPDEEWARVLEVNATGTFFMVREAARHMKAQGYGRIVNTASTTFAAGRPGLMHYVASKGAVVGMTRSMARELGGFGITVNAIMPGPIVTEVDADVLDPATVKLILDRQCIARTGAPGDLVPLVLFLASPESGFITGQTIAVDGGAIHL